MTKEERHLNKALEKAIGWATAFCTKAEESGDKALLLKVNETHEYMMKAIYRLERD